MTDVEIENYRPIRSFVRRDGRLTPAQQRALIELLPEYSIDSAPYPLNLPEIFGNSRPVVIEIGFGNGSLLAMQAQRHPEINFIGIEVYRPGIGHLLRLLDKQGSRNVRIFSQDAMDILTNRIPAHSLYALWLYFPDPWPKKRHYKRRIVNQGFLGLVAGLLLPGGVLHMVTDWPDYAEHMKKEILANRKYEPINEQQPAGYPFTRPETRFERRGLCKGYTIHDLIYRRSIVENLS